MDRYEAIQCVSKAILEDNLVEALFLKGSIARGEDDEFSDVDLYAAVSKENFEVFLSKRLSYMQEYMPLVFVTEVNFVGPQIVGVYENALHFDLYTVEAGNIPQTDSIKIISDPKNLLAGYHQLPLGVTEAAILKEVDGFSFAMLELKAAIARNDTIWASRLFSMQANRIALFLRFIFDKDHAQLASHRLYRCLPDDLLAEYLALLEHSVPSKVGDGIHMLMQFEDKVLQMLPKDLYGKMNHRFRAIVM